MKHHNHISNFKIFESESESKFITITDILDIFVEITDLGFIPKLYDEQREKYGIYFIEFGKEFSDKYFGAISKGSSYGFTDLMEIKKQLDIFDILDDAKSRLESMGYTIGFDFEFNFNCTGNMNIICHIQHSSFDQDDEY